MSLKRRYATATRHCKQLQAGIVPVTTTSLSTSKGDSCQGASHGEMMTSCCRLEAFYLYIQRQRNRRQQESKRGKNV